MDEQPLVVEKPLSKPRWIVLVSIVLSVMGLAVAGVLYTSYVDGQREKAEREADQRWCELLNTLDQAYGSAVPATDLGRRVADAVHNLRVGLDC